MWLWHGYCYDLNWRGTAERDRWKRTPGVCPFTAAHIEHQLFFLWTGPFATTAWILSGIYTLVETRVVVRPPSPPTPQPTDAPSPSLHITQSAHCIQEVVITGAPGIEKGGRRLPAQDVFYPPPLQFNLRTTPSPAPKLFPWGPCWREQWVQINSTHTVCLRICLPEGFFVSYTFFLKNPSVFLFCTFNEHSWDVRSGCWRIGTRFTII